MAEAVATYIKHAEHRGMAYSLTMHIILLLIFIIGMPSFLSPPTIDEPAAITVDVLPISALSNVRPNNSKPAKRKKETPKPKADEITEKELEDLKPEKAKPSPSVKTKDSAPADEEPVEKKDAEEVVKPKDKPKDKEKKQEEEDPLDAILKGVKDTAAKDKKAASKSKEKPADARKSGNRSNNFDPNAPETLSLIDYIHNQIYRCWNVPAGARNAENLIIPLEIDYDKTGMPTKVNLAKSASGQYRADPFFRAAAESAIRAVKRCAPLQNMPAENYHIWQYVDMNFNPKDMLF